MLPFSSYGSKNAFELRLDDIFIVRSMPKQTLAAIVVEHTVIQF